MQSPPKGAPPGTHGIQHLELLALYNITKLIGNAVDLDTTLDNILAVLNDTLKMERATLLLYDRLSERLTIKASCGLSRNTISFLGVPVIAQDQPEGVLTVDRLFDGDVSFEEDIHFLTILATLIGQFLTLHRAIEKKEKKLIKENETLKARLHAPHGRHSIIGHSKPMQEVFGIINKIAASRATVLLLGESGTGKELVARTIHDSGERQHKAFIKVNCAALPEALLESELFGHERGAFTNAHATRPGRFELADGGTIFLDEIGEMPLSLQAKMLRVLQEKQFERIGGTKTFSVDVRIITATNASLEHEVNRGRFRADLYYRLNVVPIMLPSLRERKEDIPLLFNHFLNKSNERNNRQIRMTADLLDFLIDYPWPGNVREMQNLVERMVILAEDDRLTTADLPPTLTSPGARQPPTTPPSPPSPSLPTGKSLEEIERAEVEAALRRNGWVQVRAARELGLTQRQIGYRIKKYRLSRFDSFRP